MSYRDLVRTKYKVPKKGGAGYAMDSDDLSVHTDELDSEEIIKPAEETTNFKPSLTDHEKLVIRLKLAFDKRKKTIIEKKKAKKQEEAEMLGSVTGVESGDCLSPIKINRLS